MGPNALEGVRVLELGQMLAAPYAGSIFADLGAEVIKIERPHTGDDSRRMGEPIPEGSGIAFHVFNRGKYSVELDLTSSQAKTRLMNLVEDIDILIHNLRPGVMEKFGLGQIDLCTKYPKLIYCDISAYGHVGPMSRQPGFEPIIQAFSGLASVNGNPGDDPVRLAASVCDQGTGMWAVIGALSLLARRARTGRGGVVNLSLLETALMWNAQRSDEWINCQKSPGKHGSGHPALVPYQQFETANGSILICCGNDRLFEKFCMAIGQPQWSRDPRFASNWDRVQNKKALVAMIEECLIPHDSSHWMSKLEAKGVPCSPIHTIPETLNHPQVEALQIFTKIEGKNYQFTGLPLSIDGTRPANRRLAPRLGEHNAEFCEMHDK